MKSNVMDADANAYIVYTHIYTNIKKNLRHFLRECCTILYLSMRSREDNVEIGIGIGIGMCEKKTHELSTRRRNNILCTFGEIEIIIGVSGMS